MTGLLLITHGSLGEDMLTTAKEILVTCPMTVASIAVNGDSDPEKVLDDTGQLCSKLDDGDGVLILTDLYGSTPSNIANRLTNTHNATVVSGVNLAMLLRVFNYADMTLDALSEKAVSGARDGIVITRCKQAS